ncbi:uncharacterized protein LOC114293976 [Camellia sinensis]|uniref:uncharacterized protein LOC114293976 n=1 Tax=Camellia sinensis TaxID=4442 RepID=UPI001035B7B3|nr:uncharacterized protein LOC114293976 [Camellia sinensis]
MLIDAHLLSCLNATLSPPIYSTILPFRHCADVWSALHKKFTYLSRSHIHQLKNKLNSVLKQSESMEEYLSKIKDIVSQLALASVAIDDEDLVLLTFNGLPDEFDAFKTSIRARSGCISMEELSSLLCSEAIHMEAKTKKLEPTVAFSTVKGFASSTFSPFSSRGHASRGRFSYRGGRGGRYSR